MKTPCNSNISTPSEAQQLTTPQTAREIAWSALAKLGPGSPAIAADEGQASLGSWRRLACVNVACALSALVACGGGDGGGSPAAPKRWKPAQMIQPGGRLGDAELPAVAVDASGNAMAVWAELVGARRDVWASRYTPRSGWSTPELIEREPGNAESPDVAIDAAGNAVAVWVQQDGTRYNVWTNRHTSAGWGLAQLLEADDRGDAASPRIATDATGRTLATWAQSDGTRYNVWASLYTAASGWRSPQPLDPVGAYSANNVSSAFDANGNATVIWSQGRWPQLHIWAARYTAQGSWEAPRLIDTGSTGAGVLPQIAANAMGEAIAAWAHWDGTRFSVWANRLTPASGWGTAQLAETSNAGDASNPQVILDASGVAWAIWRQSDGSRDSIWANRLDPTGGWASPQRVETDNTGNAESPQIAADTAGNTHAVWTQLDGTRHNIWANRHTTATGWGSPQLLETQNLGDARDPTLRVDAAGNALAVWRQFDGTRHNLWYARFD